MNTWKISTIVFVSIAALLLSAIPASANAVTDGTGDVHHWTLVGGIWGWQTATVEKPNIDITEISYAVNANILTITLKVNDVIQDSPTIVYIAWYNSSDASYWMSYSNSSGGGIGYPSQSGLLPGTATYSVSDDTITWTFQLIGTDTSNVALWSYVAEYTELNNKLLEWWVDYVPDLYFQGENPADTQPPSQLTGLTVNDAHNGKLNLSWDVATDNVAVDHYKIYRDNVFLLDSTTTYYQNTGLTNGQSYSYEVSAVDSSGNEGTKSDPGTGTPTASGGEADTQPPSQVTGLSVTDVHDGKLNLTWDPAADDIAVDHYKIYRDNVFVDNSTTTSHQDTGLTNNQSYTYQISAVDISGNEGERSNQISGTPTASSTDGGTGHNKKTPGFEVIVLGAALIITISLLRRKK